MPSRAGPGGRLAVDDYQRAYDALILSHGSGGSTPDPEASDSEEREFLVGAQQYAYVRLLSYRMYGEQGWIMSDIARDGDPDWIALAQAWESVLERQLDAETAIGSDSDSDSSPLEDELAAGRISRLYALLESVVQEYDTASWNARFPGFAASPMYAYSDPLPQLPPLALDPAEPSEDSTQPESGDQSQRASAPPSATSLARAQTQAPDQDLQPPTTPTAMLAAGYEYDAQSHRALGQPPRRVLSPLADADATPAIDGGGPAKEAASLAFAAGVSVGDAPAANRIRGRTGTQSSIETKVGSPEPALLAQYKSAASVKDSEDDRRILLWKWMHGAKDPVETPQFELPVMNTASFTRHPLK